MWKQLRGFKTVVIYMYGSVLTSIAGERGIRKLERCSDQKARNMPDWQEQLAICQEPRCHCTAFRCFPSGVLSLWPWHKLECLRGLAITDNQHPRDGMTTFVRQLLPANDIPAP